MRKTIKILGLGTLGITLALLSFSAISFRIVDYPTVKHPLLGRIPKPNARFLWRLEGNGSGVWSANGLRGPGIFKDPGPRLLVLGDSFAEALHVKDKEHFGCMLDQRLREHGSPWRVGTAAKSGYSTADYVARSAIFRALHNPDWVVILVSDNDFGSDAWKKRLAGYAYFEWDGADNLHSVELAYSERSLSGWASDHVPLLQPGAVFLANRLGAIQGWLKDNEQPWFHAPPPRREHSGERASLTAYPVEKEMGLLRAAYAGRLTLFYLAPFDPKEPPRKTENEAVLQKAAKQNGIEFLSLRQKYFGLSRSGHCPYGFSNTRFNEGHMNRHGHEAVAGLLYDYITSER